MWSSSFVDGVDTRRCLQGGDADGVERKAGGSTLPCVLAGTELYVSEGGRHRYPADRVKTIADFRQGVDGDEARKVHLRVGVRGNREHNKDHGNVLEPDFGRSERQCRNWLGTGGI
jgi:hypothetical protein